MLSFGRQARGRWPCTAALGTAQSRLMWNRARPAIDRPQRIPVCGSGQAACIRPVPGGAAGRREASPEWPSRPAPHRGGCGTPVYAAKGTALRKQSPCRPQRDGGSPRGGAAALTPTRRLQQKVFCYLQHPRAPAPTSSSGASCTAR